MKIVGGEGTSQTTPPLQCRGVYVVMDSSEAENKWKRFFNALKMFYCLIIKELNRIQHFFDFLLNYDQIIRYKNLNQLNTIISKQT